MKSKKYMEEEVRESREGGRGGGIGRPGRGNINEP
jgi:hypothetical protein